MTWILVENGVGSVKNGGKWCWVVAGGYEDVAAFCKDCKGRGDLRLCSSWFFLFFHFLLFTVLLFSCFFSF